MQIIERIAIGANHNLQKFKRPLLLLTFDPCFVHQSAIIKLSQKSLLLSVGFKYQVLWQYSTRCKTKGKSLMDHSISFLANMASGLYFLLIFSLYWLLILRFVDHGYSNSIPIFIKVWSNPQSLLVCVLPPNFLRLWEGGASRYRQIPSPDI